MPGRPTHLSWSFAILVALVSTGCVDDSTATPPTGRPTGPVVPTGLVLPTQFVLPTFVVPTGFEFPDPPRPPIDVCGWLVRPTPVAAGPGMTAQLVQGAGTCEIAVARVNATLGGMTRSVAFDPPIVVFDGTWEDRSVSVGLSANLSFEGDSIATDRQGTAQVGSTPRTSNDTVMRIPEGVDDQGVVHQLLARAWWDEGWSPATPSNLTLSLSGATLLSAVVVRGLTNTSGVDRVEARAPDGTWHTLWAGEAPPGSYAVHDVPPMLARELRVHARAVDNEFIGVAAVEAIGSFATPHVRLTWSDDEGSGGGFASFDLEPSGRRR